VTFEEFEAEAHRMWEEIPAEYKEGIDGIVVKRGAEAHPDHEDYFTMGMCFTEPYPSDFGGPDTTRSILALYYGSFRKVAKGDPNFPWREELWETITHELRHHLEYLADDDALDGVDYALEESYKREKGLDFDPWYYQRGVPLVPGVFRVEYDVYIERPWSEGGASRAEGIQFAWDGGRWTIPWPESLGDVHYVWVDGVETGGGWLQIVLVRRLPFLERLQRLWRTAEPEILESEAVATRIGDEPDSPTADEGRPGSGGGGPPRRNGDPAANRPRGAPDAEEPEAGEEGRGES
jgi:hypothetical protein